MKEGFIVTTETGDIYNPLSLSRYITTPISSNQLFRPYVDGAFLVVFVNEVSDVQIKEFTNIFGATIQGSFVGGNEYLIVISKLGSTYSEMQALREQMQALPETELVVINTVVTVNNTSTFPSSDSDDQFYLQDAGIESAWGFLNEKGKNIGGIKKIIGVIDDALPKNHEDLNDKNIINIYIEYGDM